MLASSRVRRLHRELEKIQPGAEVTLRLYVGAGRTRDVRVKTVAASTLPRRHRMFFGSEPFIAPVPPMAPIDPDMRHRLEEELDRAGRAIERIAPRIQRAFTTRVVI
jgi:hypothetical protein